MSRKISQAGIGLIKSFEGCRLTSYKPVPTEPYYTIGWGHYGPDVKAGMTITQAKADSMLVNDLAKYEAYVNDPAYVPVTSQLTQYQFDSLTSFCYNTGAGNLSQEDVEALSGLESGYFSPVGKVIQLDFKKMSLK